MKPSLPSPSPIAVLCNPFSPESFFTFQHSFGVRTSLSAESTPADGDKWVETNFEGAIDKLKKEAEDRLDDKIKELEGNVATVGKP